jgi:peptidoglycan/LPS O-acetylase OafA/YrhL
VVKSISKEQSIVLDLVRGVSAQIVLIGHLISFYGFQARYGIPTIQNFGVVVFFILSGFLITQTTLLKGLDYGFKNFFIDRFSRIYYTFIPALFLVLLIDLVLKYYFNTYSSNYQFNLPTFISNGFMLQSFPLTNIGPFGSARPFWTVAIEWWIYLFFGIIYFFNRIKFNFIHISLFAVSLIVVMYNLYGRGYGLSLIWFFGFALAVIYNNFNFKLNRLTFVSISSFLLIGFCIRLFFYRSMYDVGLALIFSIGLLLTFYLPSFIKEKIVNKTFEAFSRFLASYSYTLYLIHYSVIELIRVFYHQEFDFFGVIVGFIICNILAYIFYIFFEKNHYKFKNFIKVKFN